MNGGTKIRRNDKKTKYIKSNAGQGIVESHDGLRFEGTRYIKQKCD